MSQPAQEVIDMEDRLKDTSAGGIPQSAQNQMSQGGSNFSDGSGPIFKMYVKIAEEEDKTMAERWKKDADGILIFTGLFSAAVAALAAVSIQDLRPNPQDTVVFYLGNIYQLLADPNITRTSILATPLQPPPSLLRDTQSW
ncbi:hypothetical protein BGW80DRAFT_1460278 [Lactifluus volemus]|nr:hypothetical protein BGW80DRAFT_1460278 [Lactifluus volemus]